MIGDKIRSCREEKGLSQEALAELVGVTRQAVGKWEQGQALPTAENLERIEKALGLEAGQLAQPPLEAQEPSAAGKRAKYRLWKGIAAVAGLALAFALGWSIAAEKPRKPAPAQEPGPIPETTETPILEEPDWLGFREYPEAIQIPKENLADLDNAQSNIWYYRDGEGYLNEGPYGAWEWVEEPVTAGELTLALARRVESEMPILYVMGKTGDGPWAVLCRMAESGLVYDEDRYGERRWARGVGNVLGYEGILLWEESEEVYPCHGLVFALKEGEPRQVFRFKNLVGFADLDLNGEQEAVCRERYDGPYFLYGREPGGFYRGTVSLPAASQNPAEAAFYYDPEARAFGFMWEKAQYQYLEERAPIYDRVWNGKLWRRGDNGRDTRFQGGLVDGTAVTFVDGGPYGRDSYDPDRVLSYLSDGTPQPTLRQLAGMALQEVEGLTGYRPERCYFNGEWLFFENIDNYFAGVCYGGETDGGRGGKVIGSIYLSWQGENNSASPLRKEEVALPPAWRAMSKEDKALWWYGRLTEFDHGEIVNAEWSTYGERLTLADGRFYEMELEEDGFLHCIRGPYPEGSTH